MFHAIYAKSHAAVQSGVDRMNAGTQFIATERRTLKGTKLAPTFAEGKLLDMGVVAGAYAASYGVSIARWLLGGGVPLQPYSSKPKTPCTSGLKQHGPLGYALRSGLTKLGHPCGIDAKNNIGVCLADAALAVLRLVFISAPEAAIVALFFCLFAVGQLLVDAAFALSLTARAGLGWMAARRRAQRLQAAQPSAPVPASGISATPEA